MHYKSCHVRSGLRGRELKEGEPESRATALHSCGGCSERQKKTLVKHSVLRNIVLNIVFWEQHGCSLNIVFWESLQKHLSEIDRGKQSMIFHDFSISIRHDKEIVFSYMLLTANGITDPKIPRFQRLGVQLLLIHGLHSTRAMVKLHGIHGLLSIPFP